MTNTTTILFRRRVALIVVAVTAGAAAIFVYWSAANASTPVDPTGPDPSSTSSPVGPATDPGYWTPERMRDTGPAPMPSP